MMEQDRFVQGVRDRLEPAFEEHGYRRAGDAEDMRYVRVFEGGWQTEVILRLAPETLDHFTIELVRTQRDRRGEQTEAADNTRTYLSNGSAGEVESKTEQEAVWSVANLAELEERLSFARWKLARYAIPWLELKLVPQ